jgi:hypothetical protein
MVRRSCCGRRRNSADDRAGIGKAVLVPDSATLVGAERIGGNNPHHIQSPASAPADEQAGSMRSP